MSATAISVPTGTWNVDPSHSEVGFQVKHMGIATVKGKFKEFAGQPDDRRGRHRDRDRHRPGRLGRHERGAA